MKRLAIVVILAAAGWAGWWVYSAGQSRAALEAWFAARTTEGWQAEYADLSVAGFPNRLDTTIESPAFETPDGTAAWQAPFLQIFRLIYRPRHVILAFPDTQTLRVDGGDVTVASDGLRASASFGPSGRLMRAGLEAETLNIDGPGTVTALAGVTAGFSPVDPDATTYRLALAADAAAGGATVADGLAVELEIAFDAPWTDDPLAEARPQPTALEIARAEYRLGDAFLRAAGRLDIDGAGRASGDLTLRAENWPALLDQAVAAGQIPARAAARLRDALRIVTGLSGGGDTLDLPLRFTRGTVWLGMIPLGEAPRLRLP